MENNNANKLFESLIQHFDLQIKNYQMATSLVQKQRRAIANHKLQELNDVNLELDSLSVTLEQEDQKRVEIMDTIAPNWSTRAHQYLKTKKKAMPLAEFLKEIPNPYREILEEKMKELKLGVSRLKECNEMNVLLIDASRQMNRGIIELITRLTLPNNENNNTTYASGGGKNPSQVKPRNIIQIKA